MSSARPSPSSAKPDHATTSIDGRGVLARARTSQKGAFRSAGPPSARDRRRQVGDPSRCPERPGLVRCGRAPGPVGHHRGRAPLLLGRARFGACHHRTGRRARHCAERWLVRGSGAPTPAAKHHRRPPLASGCSPRAHARVRKQRERSWRSVMWRRDHRPTIRSRASDFLLARTSVDGERPFDPSPGEAFSRPFARHGCDPRPGGRPSTPDRSAGSGRGHAW